MFVDRSVPRIADLRERFSFLSSMKERITTLVKESVDASELPEGPSAHVFRIRGTAMIGAAVVQLSARFAPGEDPDALARDALEAALAALRAGSHSASSQRHAAIRPLVREVFIDVPSFIASRCRRALGAGVHDVRVRF